MRAWPNTKNAKWNFYGSVDGICLLQLFWFPFFYTSTFIFFFYKEYTFVVRNIVVSNIKIWIFININLCVFFITVYNNRLLIFIRNEIWKMLSIFTERKKNCNIKAKIFNPLQRSSFDMLICKKVFNIYYNIQYYSQCFIKKSD